MTDKHTMIQICNR